MSECVSIDISCKIVGGSKEDRLKELDNRLINIKQKQLIAKRRAQLLW